MCVYLDPCLFLHDGPTIRVLDCLRSRHIKGEKYTQGLGSRDNVNGNLGDNHMDEFCIQAALYTPPIAEGGLFLGLELWNDQLSNYTQGR